MLEVSKVSSMKSNQSAAVIPTASRIKLHSQQAYDSVSFGRALPKPTNVVVGAVTEHQKEQVEMIKRVFGKYIHEARYVCEPDGSMKVFIDRVKKKIYTSGFLGLTKTREEIIDTRSKNLFGAECLNASRVGLDSKHSLLMKEIREENDVGKLASKLYDFLLLFRIKPITDPDMKWAVSMIGTKPGARPNFYPIRLEMKAYKPEGSDKYGSYLSIGPDSMAMYPMSSLKPSMQQKLEARFKKGNGSFTVKKGNSTFELKSERLDGKEHIRVSRTTS